MMFPTFPAGSTHFTRASRQASTPFHNSLDPQAEPGNLGGLSQDTAFFGTAAQQDLTSGSNATELSFSPLDSFAPALSADMEGIASSNADSAPPVPPKKRKKALELVVDPNTGDTVTRKTLRRRQDKVVDPETGKMIT